MKRILVALATLALVSFSALALEPSEEAKQVARALVNSPNIAQKLKAQNLDDLEDVKITKVNDGVVKYDLIFGRQCECYPATASVTIIETFNLNIPDASAEYTSTIDIKVSPF